MDFYGYVKDKKKRLIQYAITYNSTNKKTKGDYLRQYYLCQLGIHYLRLGENSDFEKEIKKFMRTIKASDEYIIINELNIDKIKKLGADQKILDAMSKFVKDYNYNHKIYIKYYHGKREEDESLDSDEKIYNYNENGGDKEYKIINIDDIINKKYFFTKT